MYAAEAKKRQATSTGGANPQLVQKSSQAADAGKTRDKIAAIAGVSHDTIRKVRVIEQEANSGNETAIAARDSVKSGENLAVTAGKAKCRLMRKDTSSCVTLKQS